MSKTPLTDKALSNNKDGVVGAVGMLLDHGEMLEIKLAKATAQRDRLAEALRYTLSIMEDDGYANKWTKKGKSALAAAKRRNQ